MNEIQPETILVIGKSGQLAWELNQLSSVHYDIVCLGRDDIDLFDLDSINSMLLYLNPIGVINAAAYTAVDKAENDMKNAYALNATAVENLAKACQFISVPFVFVSTDFVFQGNKCIPYLPDDVRYPLGVYGASKAEGERLLKKIYPKKSTIIRTSWLYSTHGNNFVKTMLNLMRTKPKLGVISDQIGSPTYAKGLALACIGCLRHEIYGTHHYTDTGVASWFDFAVAIQRIGLELGLLNTRVPIHPISTSQYPTPAIRPHYSVLDKSSLVQQLPQIEFRHWQTQLFTMLYALKAEGF